MDSRTQRKKIVFMHRPKVLPTMLVCVLILNLLYMYINDLRHRNLAADETAAMLAKELSAMRLNFVLLGVLMAALLLFIWLKHDLREKKVHERTRLMLDTLPLACGLIDRDRNIIDCNQEALRLYGLTHKNDFREYFYRLSPEFQPCGKASREKAPEIVGKAFQDGYCRSEWMHQSLSGEPIPSEVIAVCVGYRGNPVVTVYIKDLRELKATLYAKHKAEENLQLALSMAAQRSGESGKSFLSEPGGNRQVA